MRCPERERTVRGRERKRRKGGGRVMDEVEGWLSWPVAVIKMNIYSY